MRPETTIATASSNAAENDVRDFLKEFASFVQLGELEGILSYYADDVIAFDMMPPLEINGVEEYRKAWTECFTDVFEFPVEYDVKPRKIIVAGDTATVIGLVHMRGRFKKTGQVDNYLRNTMVLSRKSGEWKIVHDHNSVPLGEDMKGLMELRPVEENN